MEDIILRHSNSDLLIIDDLGDFMDGMKGFTTRGGHKLPQNMSDEEAFDFGVFIKVGLVEKLVPYFDKIVVNDVVNDNHSGSFSYFVSSAVSKILKQKYSTKVSYNICRKFLTHYKIGDRTVILSHGKDSEMLKFGLKPYPSKDNLSFVDAYCKENNIYRESKYIEFSKGDSHQLVMDMSSSDDFNYISYPAFSPSSEFIQTNYKKGRSGYVIQQGHFYKEEVVIKPVFFDWSS